MPKHGLPLMSIFSTMILPDTGKYRYDSLDVRKNKYQKNPAFWCILRSDSLGRNDSLLLD